MGPEVLSLRSKPLEHLQQKEFVLRLSQAARHARASPLTQITKRQQFFDQR
jgi:hypothetical protein